jgi:hypothetical protein
MKNHAILLDKIDNLTKQYTITLFYLKSTWYLVW